MQRWLTHVIVLFIAFITATNAQTVVHHPNSGVSLQSKWVWAVSQIKEHQFKSGVWIGYGIRRLMGEDSHIGSFDMSYSRVAQSLHELLDGQKELHDGASGEAQLRREAERALTEKKHHSKSERQVTKGVAILFGYSANSDDFKQPNKIVISNLSLAVDLGERPLFWLGNAQDEESVAFLEAMFNAAQSDKQKESFLLAISIHDSSSRADAFLRKQLKEGESEKIRGSAAFWIGNRDHEEDVSLLVKVANTDQSKRVREQAVFGLSQMHSDVALEALINLAQKSELKETRSKAIFWLSQKASKRALATLKEVVKSEPDTRVQREAVFALSQLKNGDGVKELIDIAKNHRNYEVRKQAIFWLGQSKDPRAMEALVEMVRAK